MNDTAPPLGIFAAVHLQPDHGWRRVAADEVLSLDPGEGVLWVHLDRRSAVVQQWLNDHSGIDALDAEVLLSDDTRPRAYRPRRAGSLLVILRGVNNEPGADPEDLVSIRIWVEKHRVLSFSSRPLAPVQDVLASFGGEYSPGNAAELLASLASAMVARMEPAIDVLLDALDRIEERQDDGKPIDPDALLDIRRQGATLRRFLGPQKDVFLTLNTLHLPWIEIAQEDEWREATNTTFRYIEDLDAIRERIAIVNDGINARAAARASRNFNAISVAAAFFVPFTFVTSLFGMNVGGIPFAQHPHGFAMMLGGLAVWGLLQVLIFRRMHWL
jgi:zinc transporter